MILFPLFHPQTCQCRAWYRQMTNKVNTSLDVREPIGAAIDGDPTCDEAAENQTDDGTQLHHDVVITTIVVLLNAELT